MRRLCIILLATVSFSQLIKAQTSFDSGEGCLNVVDVTAGKGLGQNGSNIISTHYLHEKFINDQFSVGIGIGYGYLDSYESSAIPLYFSSHYFFSEQRFSPFVNLRAGVYWPIKSKSIQSGMYVAPSAGLKMHITSHIGILVSVGYEGHLVKTTDSAQNDSQIKMASNLGISVGLCFQIPGW